MLIAEQCADGGHLVLHDRYNGPNDNANPPYTAVLWTLDHNSTVPLAAGGFVASFDPATGRVISYDPTKGTKVGDVGVSSGGAVTSTQVSGTQTLLRVGSTVVSLQGSTHVPSVSWRAALPQLPTPSGSQTQGYVVDGGALLTIRLADGQTVLRRTLSGSSGNATGATAVGAGFLLSGVTTSYAA